MFRDAVYQVGLTLLHNAPQSKLCVFCHMIRLVKDNKLDSTGKQKTRARECFDFLSHCLYAPVVRRVKL